MMRGPFPVVTTHNFSADQRTRVMLFAINVELSPGEPVSVVTVQLVDAQQTVYPLTVEAVEKVPGFDWLTQIVVKLPDELMNTAGDLRASIRLRGVPSNNPVIGIRLAAAQSEFQNPRKVEIQGYSGSAMEPFISCDGRYLFFNNSNAPASETDIFYAERVSEDAFRFLGKVPGLNALPPTLDGVPSIDDAGNLFFVSSRSYDTTLSTLYLGVFRDGQLSEVGLGAGNFSRQQPGWLTMDAEINRDGSLLYFANARFTGGPVPAEADLGVARRSGEAFQVTTDSDDLFRDVNTGALEYAPSTSRDGLELYFTRFDGLVPVILKARRVTTSMVFGPPEPVSAISGFVEAPSISCDGSALYYHRKDGAAFSIYRVTRIV